MYREVKYLLPSAPINMGGIIVKQALPTNMVRQVDPFLLLHHGTFSFRNDALAKHQGIGPHPHRGFSPVTFVIDGEIHHRDSRGNNQIASAGEVQWMHAGAGIIHSERPSQNLVESNGKQEIIQLWINSPAAQKLKPPHYQYHSKDSFYKWSSDDEKIVSKLIAGKYNNHEGAIETESELCIIWSTSVTGGHKEYHLNPDHNTMLYLIKGELSIAEYGKVEAEQLIVFNENSDHSKIRIEALSNAQLLILSGQPINEKLVQQGPFVMNTETEILEAMRDYQMGKMGVLIEE